MGLVGKLGPHSRVPSTSRMGLPECCSEYLTNSPRCHSSRAWLVNTGIIMTVSLWSAALSSSLKLKWTFTASRVHPPQPSLSQDKNKNLKQSFCHCHANNLPSTEQVVTTKPKQDKSFSFFFFHFSSFLSLFVV